MERVRRSTPDKLNRKIDQQLKYNIQQYSNSDNGAITNRIKELEKEWDVERALEVNMPIIALSGLALGVFVHKRWLALPAVVLGFFLQHALQGWCPPLPVFRKLGYRTKEEIEKERYALKAIRGDFDGLTTEHKTDSDNVLAAVNKK